MKGVKGMITLVWILAVFGTAQAMNFPELGVCIGENVRIRASAGTTGKVIDRADAGTQFIILGETRANGKKWYRIDLPKKKGSAYIAAEFVNGWYNEGKTPVGREFAEVRLKFGITSEKTRLLLGRPIEQKAQDEFEYLTYQGCDVHFEEQHLSYVHVRKRGYEIAGCQVGDNAVKLAVFGMPESDPEEKEGWMYESASGEEIFFQFGPGKNGDTIIESITWSCPGGEG
ncbi:MAG: SH3 domain-containing protein [Synergistaceae bacterium]|nr:SH3 domain-containing protein [Synergistaceae bacterium]